MIIFPNFTQKSIMRFDLKPTKKKKKNAIIVYLLNAQNYPQFEYVSPVLHCENVKNSARSCSIVHRAIYRFNFQFIDDVSEPEGLNNFFFHFNSMLNLRVHHNDTCIQVSGAKQKIIGKWKMNNT